jgi:hypothetical protein
MMRAAGRGMRTTCFALITVVAGCVESAELTEDEVTQEAAGKPVPSIAGIWRGTGYAQPTSPVGADHETDLWIDCGSASGAVTYTYSGPFECHSTLTRTSYIGATYTFADDTQTVGCTDGVVTLTHGTGAHLNQLRFTWIYPDGTVDTSGWLIKYASAYCP